MNNGRAESREAGAVVQEGVANHPTGHGEHVILQQIFGYRGDEVIGLTLKYSVDGHTRCSSDGIQIKNDPFSILDCVFSGLCRAHAHVLFVFYLNLNGVHS